MAARVAGVRRILAVPAKAGHAVQNMRRPRLVGSVPEEQLRALHCRKVIDSAVRPRHCVPVRLHVGKRPGDAVLGKGMAGDGVAWKRLHCCERNACEEAHIINSRQLSAAADGWGSLEYMWLSMWKPRSLMNRKGSSQCRALFGGGLMSTGALHGPSGLGADLMDHVQTRNSVPFL